MIHGLCQRVPLVEHEINVKDQNDQEYDARAFELEEDDWNIIISQAEKIEKRRVEVMRRGEEGRGENR